MLSNAYFLANFRFDEKRKCFFVFSFFSPSDRWLGGLRRRSRAAADLRSGLGLANLANFEFFTKSKFCKILAARSRLYQYEIWQENMRLTAFFKLYKICTLLHRCNLNILAKKSVWTFSKIRENSARCLQMLQNLLILPNFKNFS